MKHKMKFEKMHGIGNDFIIVDAINQRLDALDLAQLAQDLCDRNFGIGADGLIVVLNSSHSDLRMRIFNADGSEPQMCGNGLRCFAKFAFKNKLVDKEMFTVETLAGVMMPAVLLKESEVVAVEVDMGEPILETVKIPVIGIEADKVINQPIEINNKKYYFTGVSMGNPHAVIFLEDLKSLDLDAVGSLFENHAFFPERVNTEFAQVLNSKEVVAIVWERGAGKTLACGTGACATVVAGVLNNLLNRKVMVHLPGGALSIEWQEADNHVIMTGPVASVFQGEIEY